MSKFTSKVVISTNVFIDDISDDGTMSFQINSDNFIVLSENLNNQQLALKAVNQLMRPIVGNAMNKVKWELETVYHYVAIVEVKDRCSCENELCQISYEICEERIRVYNSTDSKILRDTERANKTNMFYLDDENDSYCLAVDEIAK